MTDHGEAASAGPLRFARFALPPNRAGYCGPDRAGELAGYATTARVDPGLVELAQAFEGAWPYLQLLADQLGRQDPLDPLVVDSYWLGAPPGRRLALGSLGDSLRARFGGRSGWSGLAEAIPEGGWPTHACHVFCVYPWVGLMRSGVVEPGLAVLDRCRIRTGQVREVSGDRAVVASLPLRFEGGTIHLAREPVVETVAIGPGLVVERGALVALHWDWVCEVLTRRQAGWLETAEAYHLRLANRTKTAAVLAG